MKSVIRWAIDNTPAMNTIMVSVLAVGALSWSMLRREDFPRFELEIILITVPYPGASPEEVENGICQKIEEAVRSIDGLKKVTSIASEGTGSVILEIKTDSPNVQKILSEVESEVDRIPSFPDLAEEPEIRQLTLRQPTISVGVIGVDDESPEAEVRLRDMVEKVRDDLLAIPQISVAEIQGARDYQIDVEIPKSTLREYGLTLQEVARRIRRENLELPGGNIKSNSQEYLLRGKAKRFRGAEIEEIPLVTTPNGVVLTVADLGTVKDDFADKTAISRLNGKPGYAISVEAAAREDMLAMTSAVHEYAATVDLPPGYSIALWGDRSIDINDRLQLLKRNGFSGLILVFICLAMFLDIRLAFWVALGIPISILGACIVLWQFDQTLNMLSMFSFVIALGIVVDDAIVIGENIYAHREMGKNFRQAAIDGAIEVLPSVAASITTTVFAFMPMFFVSGVMGKFFAVMPLAVIAMLLVSMAEAAFILPCHLAHEPSSFSWAQRALQWRRGLKLGLARVVIGSPVFLAAVLLDRLVWPFRFVSGASEWVRKHVGAVLDGFIQWIYLPLLRRCLQFPAIVCSIAFAVLLLSATLVTSGTVPWIIFPKMDSRNIRARVVFPDGTPSHVTDAATRRIEDAIRRVCARHEEAEGQTVLELTHRLVGQVTSESPGGADDRTEGGHAGSVLVAMVESNQRNVSSQQIVEEWRAETGPIAGAETLSFASVNMGPGGSPIEFKLLSDGSNMESLEAAVEDCKAELASIPGVFDISDDSRPGKWEMQLTVKPDARTLGVPLQEVAGTVRAAYYGEEVMRLQRGRHEVKLMVRYPEEERRALAEFDEIRIDTGDGVQRPITELADVAIQRGYSEINRVNQKRSITVTADVDESRANAAEIVSRLQAGFVPHLLERYPNVIVRWEGQAEQSVESIQSLFVGLMIALLAMYVLLTMQFTSYIQPAIIMAVIPFGIIGAVWGHALMGLPLTLFSVLGLVALTGVVVNDSIVLVDFANARVRDGVPLHEALLETGQRRLRPVLLTSMTTVAGLAPIMTETSEQAQLLIPMANSLCFGLILSTTLVLVLVPTFYSIYGRFVRIGPADHAQHDSHDDRRHIGDGALEGNGSVNGNGKVHADAGALVPA
ncbi:MAG: efflux RND transporter permease subunit [Planctomycetaceae bacterium]|nr:efflux RND transporter permease subunit [Planctomycetaceae bacterium]